MMKNVRKYLTFIVMTLVFVLVACSNDAGGNNDANSSSSSANYPEENITMIISYEAGGGTDVGARILAPILEEELGVSINIENMPGGGGWIGWTELINSDPDGYTIGFLNTPNVVTGYLDPKLDRNHDLDDFTPIATHVQDPGAISIRPDDDRFSNIEELIEYAKENEITATTTGVGSNDHYAILNLNHNYGTNITPVHSEGGSDAATKVLGGHADVLFAKVGETLQLYENKEVEMLAVMAEERSDFVPDVPTLEELGYEVYSRSVRGLAGPKGLDQEIIDRINEAMEKAIEDEEHIEKMEEMGLQIYYQDGDGFMDILKSDEETIKELLPLLDE